MNYCSGLYSNTVVKILLLLSHNLIGDTSFEITQLYSQLLYLLPTKRCRGMGVVVSS